MTLATWDLRAQHPLDAVAVLLQSVDDLCRRPPHRCIDVCFTCKAEKQLLRVR